MGIVPALAEDLGIAPVTLRRAIAAGMVRAERPSPRTIRIDVGERVYLRSHWATLQALRAALRTERSVRAAVLFGSVARGTDGPGSDVDLAVLVEQSTGTTMHRLRSRLSRRLERDVALVDLADAMASPRMRRELLEDGRTIILRGGVNWRHMRPRRSRGVGSA